MPRIPARSAPPQVQAAIEGFAPRTVPAGAAAFAKEVTARAAPESANRAKAFLFAASRLGAFCESVGLDLSAEVALHPSVIERCCAPGVTVMSGPTRRTVRTNLRAIARALQPAPPPVWLGRERAKQPYTRAEIAGYLALADAQGTEARRMRAGALVCLGAGAGLVGADLKAVCGTDVAVRPGGVVVEVRAGRAPRVVPVLASYHDRLVGAARFAGGRLVIGGTSVSRRNVTTPLTASLCGGRDLPRLEVARLRATWLTEVAGAIGLRAFMDAAGITCSQRLGDVVAELPGVGLDEAVRLLGAGR
ncbi:MAG: hypothetical protein M0Z40_10195 [Actinomycetota bacterium]|nr:hypothetical protein [Actinomycetota bacterium]